jgi:predicted ester cyclase
MNAGVVKSRYRKTDLDKAIKEYREQAIPAISAHEGGRSSFLLVNRQTGDTISIGIYESEAAAKSFASKAEKLIATFEKYATGDVKPQRELYEIAASTQNEARAVVERSLKAFNSHDMEAIARDAAPDAVLTAPGDMTFKGPQQIKEFNQSWVTAFPDARVEATSIVTQGNNVVVEGVFSGTHNGTLKTPMGDIPATGRKLKGEYMQVFEIDRGLVKKAHLLFDRVQLLSELGMTPAFQPQPAKTAR